MENKEAVEVDFAITLILQIRSSKFCMVVDLYKMHIYKLYRGAGEGKYKTVDKKSPKKYRFRDPRPQKYRFLPSAAEICQNCFFVKFLEILVLFIIKKLAIHKKKTLTLTDF